MKRSCDTDADLVHKLARCRIHQPDTIATCLRRLHGICNEFTYLGRSIREPDGTIHPAVLRSFVTRMHSALFLVRNDRVPDTLCSSMVGLCRVLCHLTDLFPSLFMDQPTTRKRRIEPPESLPTYTDSTHQLQFLEAQCSQFPYLASRLRDTDGHFDPLVVRNFVACTYHALAIARSDRMDDGLGTDMASTCQVLQSLLHSFPCIFR